MPLITAKELRDRLDALGGVGTEFRACEPLEAQSVMFHALDYARALGFFAHEDFEIALFEPGGELGVVRRARVERWVTVTARSARRCDRR